MLLNLRITKYKNKNIQINNKIYKCKFNHLKHTSHCTYLELELFTVENSRLNNNFVQWFPTKFWLPHCLYVNVNGK